MKSFIRLFCRLPVSIYSLCNIKYNRSLLILNCTRTKGLPPFQEFFSNSVRQFSSANNIGENDRDIKQGGFSLLGFLTVPVLALAFTKLKGGENDEGDISEESSNKRNKSGKFTRRNSESTLKLMDRVRSAKRKLEFGDETTENSSTAPEACVTRKKYVSKIILLSTDK